MVVGPEADPMPDLDKIQQERDALATRAEELRRRREEAENGGARTVCYTFPFLDGFDETNSNLLANTQGAVASQRGTN